MVLFTGLILVFLNRTTNERHLADSSSTYLQTNLLARGAVGNILQEIREEMMHSSASTLVQKGDKNFYLPLSPSHMVMKRTDWMQGEPDSVPNLVRRSLFSDSLPVPTKASDLSSLSPSYHRPGRSPALWNRHYLIPRQDPSAAFDNTTPIAAFQAPDWIMVGKTGPKVISQPDAEIIGRYAYVIFNAGGVLDANVAGYPRGVTPEAMGEKGGVALADLTMLGLSATQVDNLIGWRNWATLEPASGQTLETGYDFSANTAAAGRYLDYLKTLDHGFRIVNPKVHAGETDRVFNNRQELIRFWKYNEMNPDSLQYLGILGTGLEIPSWSPEVSRPKNKMTPPRNETNASYLGYGGNDAYDSSGGLQDLINPSLLSATNSGGKPAIRSRFPLSRLALLKLEPGQSGPDPTRVADIQKYFGLTWNPVQAHWVYNHGNSSGIYKLSEISEDREPDFFELLKAAIHCDSLGKQHGGNGSTGGGSAGNGSPHMFVSNNAALDSSVNYQIMVIGANIIDQYDSDSFPTRILFDSAAGASFPRIFSGIENIPYLYGWRSSWYRVRQLGASDIDPAYQPPSAAPGKNGFPYETRVLMQPIVWNPHSPPTASGNSALTPLDFKVVASGMTSPVALAVRPVVKCAWWPGVPVNFGKLAAVSSFPASSGFTGTDFSSATVAPSLSWVTFSVSDTGKAAFREPYRIQSPNYPPGSNASASSVITTLEATEVGDPHQGDTLDATAIGIDAGACWTGPFAVTSPFAGPSDAGVNARCLSTGWLSSSLRFELQYKNPYSSGPEFLSFDVISEVSAGLNRESTVGSDDTVNRHRPTRTGFRADPRTNRWEPGTVNTVSSWDAGSGQTPASGVASYPSDGNGPYYYFPQGSTLSPGANSLSVRLNGNANGSIPQAPGWRVFFGANGRQVYSDLMLNSFSPNNQNAAAPGNKFYCNDPDGVLRRASGAYYAGDAGLGMSNVSSSTTASGSSGPATRNYDSRPVILNRPFRSVAELGHAFRGTPWKNLDFFTPESGDAALLDLFCLNEVDVGTDDFRVNGRLDLNTRQPQVVKALLMGVSKAEGVHVSEMEAEAVARALVEWTSDFTTAGANGLMPKGPLRNRGELVGKWVAAQTYTGGPTYNPPNPNIDGTRSYSGFSSLLNGGGSGVFSSATDGAIQRRRESVIRALVDSGETRIWNVMIDLVAQTGFYPKHVLKAGSLQDFNITGEVHCWIHLSVDRLTGEVLQQRMEIVSD